MENRLSSFESIVRRAHKYTDSSEKEKSPSHPFEIRNIEEIFPDGVKALFDNAHYSQATFEAFKFFDKEIQRFSGLTESGYKLMMQAFDEGKPKIKLNSLASVSERDEQRGFQFLFAGGIMAIRNPRGHEYTIKDDAETCLDHLSMISMGLKRIKTAGYK
jgi:uncharacterized protein (TIGR02391 family)